MNTSIGQHPIPPEETLDLNQPTQIQASGAEIAQFHADLHSLVVMPADENTVRQAFRKHIVEYTGAVGVAHIIRDADGSWDVKPNHASGRVPRRHDFLEKFGRNCEATIQRNSIQIESFLGLKSIFAPVPFCGSRHEVMMVLAEDDKANNTIFLLQVATEYFGLWLKDSNSNENVWKLTSLAALIELVSEIEHNDSEKSACETAVNELIRHLKCQHAAIATFKNKQLKVQAISGQLDTSANSEAIQLNETALNECILRDDTTVYPTDDQNNQHLLLAHKQLSKEFDYEAVLSTPMRTPDGELRGAILVAGNASMILGDRLPNFVRAASPRIASAIEVVSRAEISRTRKLINSVNSQLKTVEGKIWYALAAVLICTLLIPLPYRVRCTCELDATTRRFAVAPFDGLVKRGFVQPGDMVEQGQVLARMDGQSLRFRMASVSADLAKAHKQREIELSNRNIPKSLVAEFEAKSLESERKLLQFQEKQIEICSPINGIVLSGNLEKSEGASVDKGQTLFEVGPINELNVEIAVPAEEIAQVAVGQNVRVWIDGFESESFTANIESIAPRSELKDARNVFVAQLKIQNPNGRFRPGMKGNIRIDCSRHTLFWNLFHKPWNYVMSRVTWW